MAIKQHYEEAMQKIVAERDREVAIIKQKVTQEQIVPHNNETDNYSNNAIAKLQKEFADKSSVEQQAHNTRVNSEQQAYNDRITCLQKDFTDKKQQIIEAGNAEKEEFARATIAAATAEVMVTYDTAIQGLRDLIQKTEE